MKETMKLEKKQPEYKIDLLKRHKNPWASCICSICSKSYTVDDSKHLDEKGTVHTDWKGQNLSGRLIWTCAKCQFESKEKINSHNEQEQEQE